MNNGCGFIKEELDDMLFKGKLGRDVIRVLIK